MNSLIRALAVATALLSGFACADDGDDRCRQAADHTAEIIGREVGGFGAASDLATACRSQRPDDATLDCYLAASSSRELAVCAAAQPRDRDAPLP